MERWPRAHNVIEPTNFHGAGNVRGGGFGGGGWPEGVIQATVTEKGGRRRDWDGDASPG